MGANDSYETFVRLHADALFTTAYMLTGKASEAEELLRTRWCGSTRSGHG